MSWHYRVRHRTLKGQDWYDIVEFYPGVGKGGWTIDGMEPGGETQDELIKELEMMLTDAKKYPVLDEEEA